jgi:hypothetical protein
MLEPLEDRRLLSAISFVKNIGVNTNFTTNSSSLTVTVPAGGVEQGHSIIVELSMDPKAGAVSATDSAGNTYQVDKDIRFQATGSPNQGVRTVVFSSHGVNPLAAGQTITVTFPTAKAKAVSAAEFCGIDAVSPVDLTKGGMGTSSGGAVSTTGTAVTTQPNELLIGAVGVQGFLDDSLPLTGGFTPGTGYTALAFTGTPSGNSGNNNITLFPEYQIVSATGNYQADGILSTNASGVWAAAMVAYKADAATHFDVIAPATVGSEIPFSVTVVARDAANNPVPGYTGTIHFTVTDPVSGEVLPMDYTFTTADAGSHTFTNGVTLIGGGLRTITVTDDCGALTGSAVVNVLAPHLAFDQQPTNTVAGAAISPPVTVRVENADNSLRTTSIDTITLSIESGPGTFTPGSTVTVAAVGGIATFGDLHINTAGTYTLRATDVTNPAIGFVISTTFTIVADVAHHLQFVQQPADTVVGNTISPAVTVQILDQFNNPTNSTAMVGLGITSGTPLTGGPGTLSGGGAVAASGGVATFSGLAIDQVGAGYQLQATSSGLLAADSSSFNITPRTLTVSATGVDKVYDGTTAAMVVLSDNRLAGDLITISYASAVFSDKNVGTDKPVSVTGISISGPDAGNYTLVSTTAMTTADITARALTVSATGIDKVYDGTTAATVTLSDDRVSGDALATSYTLASFADKHVGTNKPVSVTGISISGADAGNYTLVSTTAMTAADITARALTVSATGIDKVYDGTTAATVTLSDDRVSGDSLATSYTFASFADKHVGTNKPVSVTGISISGADAGNYTFNTTAMTTADITARSLTISATGIDKVYDGTTAATVTLSDNRVAGDALTASYTSASFADKHVGTNKPVSVAGISISGPDAGNYTFNTTAMTTADITARTLLVSATGIDKVYDGTTAATVTLSDDRVAGDTLTTSYTSAQFADPNVGMDKPVTVTGISISGPDAGNYTLASTTAMTTADITFEPVTLSGQKFNDLDGDGVKDLGEPGLAGWTIQLDLDNNGSVDQIAATDSSGSYSFSGVGPGMHMLSESLQGGWLQTFPAAPGTYTVTTQSGVDVGGRDFGNFKLGRIAGVNFNDLDGDGVKDAGEPGLADWTIFLDTDTDGMLDPGEVATTTTADGSYEFTGLTAGTYTVAEVLQFGWTQTFPVPVPPGSHSVLVVSGTNDTDSDFANAQFIEVSGQKFNDLNGNGAKDAGEPGLEGWTIQLDLDNDGSVDEAALTDASGNYWFDFVPPGTHLIREVLQAGWTQTFPAAPGTYLIVAETTDLAGLDFGNFELVTLSGQKFEDENANGIKDAGEPGLPDWTIQLDVDNDGDVDQTTTTDSGGNYSFSGVGPGTHKLSELQEAGWIQSVPAAPGFYALTTQSGVDSSAHDFGNFRPAEVHGRKFSDSNADGSDNGAADPGIAGITIQLIGTDGAGNPVSLQTITLPDNPGTPGTDETGAYAFTGLNPGVYTISEISPVGFVPTAPASGNYDVVLSSGEIVQGLDFGNHFEGASFDFNDLNSPTAAGYIPVPSFSQFSTTTGYGWQTAPPQSGFDRGGPDDLRRDGHYGSADNTFQVLLPNGLYRVDAVIGDALYARDNMSLYAEGNLVAGNLSSAGGDFVYPSFVIPVSDGRLDVRFHDAFSDGSGGDPFWVVNALEIHPLDLTAHTISAPGGSLVSDGVTVDTFTATGATPNSLVTVTTNLGTIVSPDADAFYLGVQVVADANGDFAFSIRRPTGAATAQIISFEVMGSGAGIALQDYVHQDIRLLDFNLNTSPTAAGAFGVASFQVYSSQLGYGWQTAPPQAGFDRGTPDSLLRDGHYGSAPNTFQIQVVPGASYLVTLRIRDTFARDNIAVSAEGVPVVSGLAVPANTTVTHSFTISSADGILDVMFQDGGGDPFWIINAIELALQTTTGSTRFFVVDATADNTYQYDSSGNSVAANPLDAGNSDPRGATSNVAGTTVWVIDSNHTVYVYDGSGALQGSWAAGGLSQPEGIATDGTDIWIVDAGSDQVHRYLGAANLLAGSPSPDSSFGLSLVNGNSNPTGITANGTNLWVVNNNLDKVFKYTVAGAYVSSWNLNAANSAPTGVTLDPSGVSTSLWVVDAAADRIFEYENALGNLGGSLGASYALDVGNANSQGIADPPPANGNADSAIGSPVWGLADVPGPGKLRQQYTSCQPQSMADQKRAFVRQSPPAGLAGELESRWIDRLLEEEDWPLLLEAASDEDALWTDCGDLAADRASALIAELCDGLA